jgi:hypothetical protein
MQRPADQKVVGKLSPRHHIDSVRHGMTRNPMRRLGTTIAALSAANAWSFKRPIERIFVRVELGCLTHRQQSGRYPRQSD